MLPRMRTGCKTTRRGFPAGRWESLVLLRPPEGGTTNLLLRDVRALEHPDVIRQNPQHLIVVAVVGEDRLFTEFVIARFGLVARLLLFVDTLLAQLVFVQRNRLPLLAGQVFFDAFIDFLEV